MLGSLPTDQPYALCFSFGRITMPWRVSNQRHRFIRAFGFWPSHSFQKYGYHAQYLSGLFSSTTFRKLCFHIHFFSLDITQVPWTLIKACSATGRFTNFEERYHLTVLVVNFCFLRQSRVARRKIPAEVFTHYKLLISTAVFYLCWTMPPRR